MPIELDAITVNVASVQRYDGTIIEHNYTRATHYLPRFMSPTIIDPNRLLLREVRNILNKITVKNMNKLAIRMINLGIDTSDRLNGVFEILYNKAISDTKYVQIYAQLSKVLCKIKVPAGNDSSKLLSFRSLLLARCQKTFDRDDKQDPAYVELLEEADRCIDEEHKLELLELAEERLSKVKSLSLGNIIFCGELFKLSVQADGFNMNDCIDRLLGQESDEQSMKCLCRLLKSIGSSVDKPNNSVKMNTYIGCLDRIVSKKELIQPRTRFMIMDILDMRKNEWISRRKDNRPKRKELDNRRVYYFF